MRQCPSCSSAQHAGKTKKGLDGKMWESRPCQSGYRWFRKAGRPSVSKKIPSKAKSNSDICTEAVDKKLKGMCEKKYVSDSLARRRCEMIRKRRRSEMQSRCLQCRRNPGHCKKHVETMRVQREAREETKRMKKHMDRLYAVTAF